jgi:hypothetical protein
MPRITRNPTTDECPSYNDEDHAAVREMIIAGHPGQIPLTHDGAVEQLKVAWQRVQDRKIARWDEQELQDQAICKEEERIGEEHEAQMRQEREKEEEDAK